MRRFWIVWCAFLAACGSSPESSTPPPATEIKPRPREVSEEEGRHAFERGLAAVKEKDWDLATVYFEKARKAEPHDPDRVYNLGLAHGQAGHEVQAIAWLKVWLLLAPNADNVAAVQEEIGRLNARAREKAETLTKAAVLACDKLSGKERDDQKFGVAKALASARQIDEALEVAKGAEKKKIDELWKNHFSRLAWDDALEVAEEDLKKVGDPTPEMLSEVVYGYLRRGGSVDKARKHALKSGLDEAMESVFNHYSSEGDLAPIEAGISGGASARLKDAGWAAIGRAQAWKGNIAAAKKAAASITSVYRRQTVLQAVAFWQLDNNAPEDARVTAREIVGLGIPDSIVEKNPAINAAAILGNVDGAIAVATEVEKYNGTWGTGDVYYAVDRAYAMLARAYLAKNDRASAVRMAEIARQRPPNTRLGHPDAEFARAAAAKGRHEEAVEHAVKADLWVRDGPLKELARKLLDSQNLAATERIVAHMSPLYNRDHPIWKRMTEPYMMKNKIRFELELAEAYGTKKQVADSLRLLEVARASIQNSDWAQESFLAPELDRVVELLSRFGEDAKATALKRDIRVGKAAAYAARLAGNADVKRCQGEPKEILQKMAKEAKGVSPSEMAEAAAQGIRRPLTQLNRPESR